MPTKTIHAWYVNSLSCYFGDVNYLQQFGLMFFNEQELLRRVCVSRYPRVDVASLTGVAWMSFLDRNRESKPFSTGGGMVLMTEPYRKKPDLDANALLSCCRSWIAELPTPK
ncbi:MAG TPA: DUF4381 domain-containing protein [Nitrospirales bacterium]|nr:DUF4381 domain-containing protein [Nitrospirales bacterium]